MTHPSPRRILLAATGLSPQILTETLYALGVPSDEESEPFIPTEIYLITTEQGAQIARAALLHPDGGQFHALLADYPQLGNPAFDESHIYVIRDSAGRALADIRSPEENACAADSITALMSKLTSDATSQLHVSIAGGRKTMGFYLGYAFSLFARPQDELSHVLVSSPFESHPDFFYPPAQPRRLTTRDGRHIDTAEARITLARIPVVSLRHGQPQALLQGQASFGDTVRAIQDSLAPPNLHIDIPRKKVLCGGTPIKLPPVQLAWLAWWAQQTVEGHPEHGWRTANAAQFLQIYERVTGKPFDPNASGITSTRLKSGMEKEFFQESNSRLEASLKKQLGLAVAPYLLATKGTRPNTVRCLSLQPHAITLVLGQKT